jgi:GNAT superfamily N-acetyltransferase
MKLEGIIVRPADPCETSALAKLWFDGWQDAHAEILPTELKRLRTLDSFRDRMSAALPRVRVIGPLGAPLGFSMIKGDELYQLYVAAAARGTGVAAALIADVEARLDEEGVAVVWLACAIGNARAARFYEKCGWNRAGTIVSELETSEGLFPLEVWRYEKALRGARR